MKVLCIGPVSYVGGVSVHMNRLMGLLNEDVDFLVLDDSPLSISKHEYNLRNIWSLCSNLRLIKSSDIIHIHCGNWILRIVLIVIAKLFRKKS